MIGPVKVLLALLFAASAMSVAAQGAPEKPKVHIAVGGKAALYYLPLTIAERLYSAAHSIRAVA